MSLPPIRQIKRDDVPGAPGWVEGLLSPLNLFFDSVFRLLAGGLEFGANISATVRDVRFTTSATYTSNDWTDVRTQSGLRRRATSVTIQRVRQVGNNDPVVFGAVGAPQWSEDSGEVSIHWISGLANSTTYNVRLLIW